MRAHPIRAPGRSCCRARRTGPETSGPARAEQRHDGLRADILHPPAARISHRLLERRPRDSLGGLPAVLPLPARQQPFRAGQFHFPRRPRTGSRSTLRSTALTNPAAERLRARFTSSTLSPPPREPARAPDSEAGRCPFAARCAPRDPALDGVAVDQVIELRPVAQHAEDDLGGEPGIARIEPRASIQQVRSIAALPPCEEYRTPRCVVG